MLSETPPKEAQGYGSAGGPPAGTSSTLLLEIPLLAHEAAVSAHLRQVLGKYDFSFASQGKLYYGDRT
jgi:hypothetical protein